MPGVGWSLQALRFLFLHRNLERDGPHMAALLGYLRDSRYPLVLLLFPEGTDLSRDNLAKSHAFARERGLPEYQYVLHPRTSGFVQAVQVSVRAWNVPPL